MICSEFSLIFQPTKVLAEIANCVGAGVTPKLVVQLKSSKAHGSGTDFIKAITKTADVSARIKNMTQQDLHYANEHLDPNCFGTSIHQNCDNIYKIKKKTTDIPQTTKNLFWDRAPLTVG